MSTKYLLTAFSKDRPGIVADISRVIYEIGYNLEDSSMTYLAGEFAILLMMSPPNGNGAEEDALETLSRECRRLEREKNITAFVRPLAEEVPRENDTQRKSITVEGVDQTGIVFKISEYLANTNINIQTLESKVKQTPQSGADLYEMKINVDIPKSLSMQKIEDELGALGDHLNVDITIS